MTSHHILVMAPSLLFMPLLVLLFLLCSVLQPPAVASDGDLLMLDRFHRWMSAHGRTYPSTGEKLRRLEVYRRNVEFIEATNRDSARLGYELGENQFTDLTNEEFHARYIGGAILPREATITTLAGDVNEEGRPASTVDLNASLLAPENFDWRDEKYVVLPARDQGECWSSWAFAAVSTVESLMQIKTGHRDPLSEQELLDCCESYIDPCDGGSVEGALKWIQAKGGLVTLYSYPYQAKQGKCQSRPREQHHGRFAGVREVSGEYDLKLAVLKRPVAVHIDASGGLRNYKNGIFYGPCSDEPNHAVVLVGYGVDSASGQGYWILKNSWGPDWGQNGFFFLKRGVIWRAGMCGIAVEGYYPVSWDEI